MMKAGGGGDVLLHTYGDDCDDNGDGCEDDGRADGDYTGAAADGGMANSVWRNGR